MFEKLVEAGLNSLRVTLYDVLAALLPGLLAIGVARYTLLLPQAAMIDAWHKRVFLAYVAGYAIQGIAGGFIRLYRLWKRPTVDGVTWNSIRSLTWNSCSTDLNKVTGSAVDNSLDAYDAVAAYCLVLAPGGRAQYELFLALAEMVRGFAVCCVLGIIATSLGGSFSWPVLLSLLVGLVGFVERYWRLQPLPNAIALMHYVGERTKAATLATTPNAPAPQQPGASVG